MALLIVAGKESSRLDVPGVWPAERAGSRAAGAADLAVRDRVESEGAFGFGQSRPPIRQEPGRVRGFTVEDRPEGGRELIILKAIPTTRA